jgi:hypothetical protein
MPGTGFIPVGEQVEKRTNPLVAGMYRHHLVWAVFEPGTVGSPVSRVPEARSEVVLPRVPEMSIVGALAKVSEEGAADADPAPKDMPMPNASTEVAKNLRNLIENGIDRSVMTLESR